MSTITAVIGKFVWHEHASTEPAKAQKFYSELLGWEYEVFKPGEIDYAMISSGGRMLGGFPPVPEGTPPHWVGNVLVESADDSVAKAKSAGGRVIIEPMDIPDVGRYAVIADPQGAVIALIQPTGDEGQLGEGVFVWDELVTSDVEAAKRFYGGVFGWTSSDMDMGQGFNYTLFKRAGGEDAAGAMPLGDIQAPPHWLPYIKPDDIDSTTANAKKLGATVIRDPWDIEGIGRLAIVQDPTGAVFGLFTPSS